MSADDWGDIEQVDAKPSRFPKWLLFCGGGCLVMVVLLIVALVFLWDKVKDAPNPDVQYPKLEQHVGLDRRPADVQIKGFEIRGQETYALEAEDGSFVATFLAHSDPSKKAEFERLLDVGSETPGMQDPEAGTVMVQGRELRVLRGRQQMKVPLFGNVGGAGPVIYVDLAEPESATSLVLMYFCPEREDEISDQELIDFLAPFHIGPERSPLEDLRQEAPEDE